MDTAFVIDRTEIARWGQFRLTQDTLRRSRRRGETDRGDRLRFYTIEVGNDGGILRVARVSPELAEALRENKPGARKRLEAKAFGYHYESGAAKES